MISFELAGGASAARSRIAPVSWLGKGYISVVRGVPDIAFFLFFVIALDQAFEWTRHQVMCPEWTDPVRQGNDFIVCQAAKLPLGEAPQWIHEVYGFFVAVFTRTRGIVAININGKLAVNLFHTIILVQGETNATIIACF